MKLAKYLKFTIPSLLFFAIFESFLKSRGLSHLSIFVLFLVSMLSSFWITRYRFFPLLLNMLLTTGVVLFVLTLGKSKFQSVYVIFSSLLFSISLVGLDKFSKGKENYKQRRSVRLERLCFGFNLNQTIVLISIFLLSSGIYGVYIDLDLPTWIVMIVIFASVSIATLYLTKINFLKNRMLEVHLDSFKNKTFVFYSFLSGFIVAEIVWAMSFLPANHLTVGAVILSVYYFFWNILKSYFENKAVKRTIISNLTFFAVAVGIIFCTGKWNII